MSSIRYDLPSSGSEVCLVVRYPCPGLERVRWVGLQGMHERNVEGV